MSNTHFSSSHPYARQVGGDKRGPGRIRDKRGTRPESSAYTREIDDGYHTNERRGNTGNDRFEKGNGDDDVFSGRVMATIRPASVMSDRFVTELQYRITQRIVSVTGISLSSYVASRITRLSFCIGVSSLFEISFSLSADSTDYATAVFTSGNVQKRLPNMQISTPGDVKIPLSEAWSPSMFMVYTAGLLFEKPNIVVEMCDSVEHPRECTITVEGYTAAKVSIHNCAAFEHPAYRVSGGFLVPVAGWVRDDVTIDNVSVPDQ